MIVSDATWKCAVNAAYSQTGRIDNYWLSWPTRYDARNEIGDFAAPGFDDASWTNATQKGVPPVAPWNTLIARTIPQWKDFGFIDYANAGSLTGSSKQPTSILSQPPITPANASTVVLNILT